ncbi:acyltransferase [Pseudomonas fluorescens]|nr:acyltransferase [Pseudomonas fluorescens]QTV16939.1 acyltransferase [Pseudomonas fluorescens]
MGQGQRVEALDYLRGVMALSIMIYHYVCGTIGDPDGNTVLGRLGIYGVSLFYIISGASLFLAYRNSSWGLDKVSEFWKKRLLRLAPIYWIACIGFLFKLWRNYSIETVMLNLSMTFGFLGYTKGIPAGSWSIGNEVCFYLAFPIVIICARRWAALLALLLVSLVSYIHFAFNLLGTDKSLAEQWFTYIHPFNQIFLFVVGVALSKFSLSVQPSRLSNVSSVLLLVVAALGMFFYENTPEMIQLVTGYERLVFTLFSIIATFACLRLALSGKTFIEKGLKHLGEMSYSIYMLHSVTFFYVQKFIPKSVSTGMPLFYVAMFISVPLTLYLASLSYRYIETPFIRLGKMKDGGFIQNIKLVFRRQA